MVVLPGFFLGIGDFDLKNDCCSSSAFFSPAHRLSLYVVIGLCVLKFHQGLTKWTLMPPRKRPKARSVCGCLRLHFARPGGKMTQRWPGLPR